MQSYQFCERFLHSSRKCQIRVLVVIRDQAESSEQPPACADGEEAEHAAERRARDASERAAEVDAITMIQARARGRQGRRVALAKYVEQEAIERQEEGRKAGAKAIKHTRTAPGVGVTFGVEVDEWKRWLEMSIRTAEEQHAGMRWSNTHGTAAGGAS